MRDYRGRPKESPEIWCMYCGKLVPADQSKKIMATTFHVDQAGIFPFGVCGMHAVEQPVSKETQQGYDL
ncbi:hypothetical protein JI721_03985 [Alicyclobacillus cycloheptanicus]|uniref:Ribosomal protein S26 n=1 Tax=Alicyclobacillus cycloheptanicus TaxID=1457 RepID=A0ABT9XMR1_9BACL|nr:hypothetical protein [Alicyclobacillus cycloheptanicus]MDQ0191606.1 ribosomal protein S26 [Alicyclobacillus cycloheptanicus]WDM02004.1 hypothetical protein JI721_03985 [Alicyclobacillus cycloheptanicus]